MRGRSSRPWPMCRGVVVDLGSGGGVPGLVIAAARPDLQLVLVDRRRARTDHLVRLVRRLDLMGRVTVHAADALDLTLPSPADAVVARGFGPPAATARAAGRVLRDGGLLVVSEPPGARADRWAGVAGFAARRHRRHGRGLAPRLHLTRHVPGADCSTWNTGAGHLRALAPLMLDVDGRLRVCSTWNTRGSDDRRSTWNVGCLTPPIRPREAVRAVDARSTMPNRKSQLDELPRRGGARAGGSTARRSHRRSPARARPGRARMPRRPASVAEVATPAPAPAPSSRA